MKGYEAIGISTHYPMEFYDITSEVRQFVKRSSVKNGIVLVFTPHTTAGITINENADPSVTLDIREFISKKIPKENYFRHMEGNSDSHIMSSLFSASETLIVQDNDIVLGTWQGIYFCEFDGPRQRQVYLKIIPS